MKVNKKIIILLVVFSITLIINILSVDATNENTYDFENFTEDDAISFVEEHNIEIPNAMLGWEGLGDFTKNLIVQSYRNHNIPFSFNRYIIQQYAEAIRGVIDFYVDNDGIYSTYATNSYVLQHNTVQDSNGNWGTSSNGYYNLDWTQYNCYAYALNRCEMSDFYSNVYTYEPGVMSTGNDILSGDYNVRELAELVKNDLLAMGYFDVYITENIPNINDNQELICVRMMDDWEYHFMRYDQGTDAWYHKPGQGAIMKYNYVPSNDLKWQREWSIQGKEYKLDGSYDSDIIFIRYSKNIIDTSSNGFQSIKIQQGKDVFYELTFDTIEHYILRIISNYNVQYEIYNSNFDLVLSGLDNNVYTCLSVDQEKYYLRMNFESDTIEGTVNVSLFADYREFTCLDEYIHTSICNACGYTKFSLHNYHCYENIENLHNEICTDCGYYRDYITNPHYLNIDINNHIVNCLNCDYSVTESHTYEARQYNAFEHNLVCVCGNMRDERQEHIWTGDWGGVKCLLCGYKKALTPGDDMIIIKGKELEIEEETR